MYRYVHGGDIYSAGEILGTDELIDFSVNINPLGLPASVRTAVIEAVGKCDRYPDPFCRELSFKLAKHEGIDPEHLLISNGASDILFRLALAYKPEKALLLAPTFADYEKALRTVGCKTEYYLLKERTGFCVEKDYKERIDKSLDIVVLCNPNNPTGQVCEREFLKEVIEKCNESSVMVLVDECFIDFLDDCFKYTVKQLIREYPNLMVLKAFTKNYAMPGIRLGYVLTSNIEILNKMRECGQDWSVSIPAQAAGICALDEHRYIEEMKMLIKTERMFLTEQLKALGMTVYGSMANYIFFRANGRFDLKEKMLARGFLIRSCANYVNLSGDYYRIAVRKREDNSKLIDSLKEILSEG